MNLAERIGGVDIEEYVFESKTNDQTPEKISQLTQKIEEMGGPEGKNAFPYEKKALERLCLTKASLKYPTLDLSFLDMVQIIEDGKMTVPRFAVFPVDSAGEVRIYFHHNCLTYYFIGEHDLQEDVLTIFSKHIYRGMKDYLENMNNDRIKFNIGDIILPSETRKKIQLAESTFRKKNLYMISEAKTSNLEVVKDPLVVGVIGDQCFLIDKFDPTPMEDYVASEFKIETE